MIKTVSVEAIRVKDRIREDMGTYLPEIDEESLDGLANSIKNFGLLQPLVVTSDYLLLCGERRLRAAKLAGLEEVPVIIRDETDPVIRRQIEIEENVRRKNFTWQEKTKAINEFHKLKQELYGEKPAGATAVGWSSFDTASELGISQASVALARELAMAIELLPELADAKTQDEAYKKWKAVKQTLVRERAAQEHKEAIASGRVLEQELHLGDCLQVMKEMATGSIDIIATDPPYGVDIEEKKKRGTKVVIYTEYEDDTATYTSLITSFFELAMKVTKPNAMFFVCIGWEYYEFVKGLMLKHGLTVDPSPIVWIKPGGQVLHPEIHFARAYELILFGIKGQRYIVKQGLPNWVQVPPIPPQHKEHPLEKPVELWYALLDRVVEPGDAVLDPFAGTGSALLAAKQLGCRVIGIEKDPYYHSILTRRLSGSAS